MYLAMTPYIDQDILAEALRQHREYLYRPENFNVGFDPARGYSPDPRRRQNPDQEIVMMLMGPVANKFYPFPLGKVPRQLDSTWPMPQAIQWARDDKEPGIVTVDTYTYTIRKLPKRDMSRTVWYGAKDAIVYEYSEEYANEDMRRIGRYHNYTKSSHDIIWDKVEENFRTAVAKDHRLHLVRAFRKNTYSHTMSDSTLFQIDAILGT